MARCNRSGGNAARPSSTEFLVRRRQSCRFKDTVPETCIRFGTTPHIFMKGAADTFPMAQTTRGALRILGTRIILAHVHIRIPLAGSFCILCILALRRRSGMDWSSAWLAAWALSAVALLALVVVMARHLAPFLVLFWLAAWDMAGAHLSRARYVIANPDRAGGLLDCHSTTGDTRTFCADKRA